MKLVTSVIYELNDLDNSSNNYIVKPITWFIKSNINSKEETIIKEIERCINSVEIPLEHIENTNQFIIQFNTDLYIDNTEPKLGGCLITGATVHASSLSSKKINILFKKQLVKQILKTIKNVKETKK